MKKVSVFVVRETILESIVKDVWTFGILVAAQAVNYYFTGNSVIVGGALLICWMIWLMKTIEQFGKGHTNVFPNFEKAINYLELLRLEQATTRNNQQQKATKPEDAQHH